MKVAVIHMEDGSTHTIPLDTDVETIVGVEVGDPPMQDAWLMQINDGLTPLLEHAEGVRARMVGRGWGEGPAEMVSTTILMATLHRMMGAQDG